MTHRSKNEPDGWHPSTSREEDTAMFASHKASSPTSKRPLLLTLLLEQL